MSEPGRGWRITTVIGSLGCGGAERIVLWLSAALAQRGHTITLVTTDAETPDFYLVPSNVSRVRAPLDAHLSCRWYDLGGQRRRLAALRRAVLATKPDVVLAFLDTLNVSVLLALWRCSLPVVVSEQTDPRFHDIGGRWRLLRWLTYPRAKRVVLLTSATVRWAQSHWPKWRAAAISNPVVPHDALSLSSMAMTRPTILGVGRLSPEKGFDLLIRAFALFSTDCPQWRLEIVGDGPERQPLLQLARQLGVSERVHLPGSRKDPFAHAQANVVFVLSSRYEGFGLALAEAMAAGLPVLSFDCPSGPREIIRHGIDGLLVPAEDVAALAAAMRRLVLDGAERARLAARAPEVLQRFSPDVIIQRWERLIAEVMQEAVA